MKSDWEFAVMVEPWNVIIGRAGDEGVTLRGTVEVPTMIAVADGAMEIGVPDIVIAGPPGTRV